MLHVLRSELTRLGQRRVLLAWFGLTALFAIMVNTVMASVVTSASMGDLPSPGVTFPTLAELQAPSGLVAGVSSAVNLLGVVTLSMWAILTAQDHSTGLIRLLVAAEPRRWRLLAGKVVALTLVTALVALVGVVANIFAAGPTMAAAGVDTSAWGTDLPAVLWSGWSNLFLALSVWGVLGLLLATLTRSAAASISIGVAYVLLVESMIRMADGVPTDWLLGSTLGAIARGGTAAVSYGAALTLGVGDVIVALAVAGFVFARRDVTE
ncbi:MAG: hypothetical protein U0869_04225 [Chloroflexota bacterium]